MTTIKDIKLTDDTLKNIYIMAPHLNELGQHMVFALMWGLIKPESGSEKLEKEAQPKHTA